MQDILIWLVLWIVLGSITSAVVSVMYRDYFEDGYTGYNNTILFLLGTIFPATIIAIIAIGAFRLTRYLIVKLFKIDE
jgi:heme/copper-type cytochrome/quinol oxidase subunit 2